ncbi:hypothetical protein [Streptacidiphilus jiangxiensis]|uniref:Amino acid efflux transporter n=1 Tax=Streptacidiphilus jiangxiensis TaxID=235985 RepID=A0A1H7KZF1_STRJI|nr:hypothetical protein [Streptacidiphilus jiangxiensis]SEK91357.1 amino acid efflux transporter [Streptacidiphilus jiangxiensis]
MEPVPRPEPRIAAGLAGGVLGAGMLVAPPVVAALAAGDSLLVWAAHILLGGSVSLLLSALVRARLGPDTLSGAVGALLGRWARRAVDGVFAVAFTAGQAAIAWFAATCLLTAAHGTVPRPGAGVLLLALGMLAMAVAAALGPLSLPGAVLRLRPWVVGALALADAVWVWPAVHTAGPPTPLAVTGWSPFAVRWLAFAALFFAGVGWEAVTRVVPTAAAGPRRTVVGVVLGTATVAVVYLGLAEAQRLAAGPEPESAPAPLRWLLAGATAVVLTSYCFTNVRTAARIAARLRPTEPGRTEPGRTEPGKALIGAVGAACCAFACLGTRDGAVPLLLLGPAAAAVTGYALAAVAAVRRGHPLLRVGAAVVLLVLLATAVLAVPALLGG